MNVSTSEWMGAARTCDYTLLGTNLNQFTLGGLSRQLIPWAAFFHLNCFKPRNALFRSEESAENACNCDSQIQTLLLLDAIS